ncbi:MAG: hypothetical protein ACW98D_10145 [Promethearchaeota archaeon]|jgi:hypothetical protein
MSEEEEFKSIIQEIKDIYLFLTQGEPNPDDEIEARVSLIELIKNLTKVNSHQVEVNIRLLEDVLTSLEYWDTLDLWFTESELPDQIKKIINLTAKDLDIEDKGEVEDLLTKETKVESSPAQIDIKEIVDQVSDKFKGEIDDLKHKIDSLQHEIDVKDETIKQATQKKVIKITPKKNVKLPPPMIKIPVTKKPEKPPQIRGQIKTDVEKPKEIIGVKSIEDVQVKIENEIKKLNPTPSSPLTPPPTPPSSLPKFQPSSSRLEVIPSETEELKPIPIRPEPKIKEDLPKDSTSVSNILDEQKSEYKEEESKLTETKTPATKKSLISTEASLIEDEPVESKKSAPFIIQDTVERPEPEPFLAQTPKISSVSVEEVETEIIQSSGTDLFNVFSSVGDKRAEKLMPKQEFPSLEPSKEKKKKETKKKKKETDTMPFVGFETVESQNGNTAEEYSDVSTDELPKDKDSLYQELIALEGRRYSLEKNFKELEKNYNEGSIADFEYKNRSEDLKNKQDDITSRINRIRRVIASM